MCGRYGTLGLDWSALQQTLKGLGPLSAPEGFQPRISLAPHQYAPIIHLPNQGSGTPEPIVTLARWDLVPHWWSKPLEDKRFATFNARLESVAEKPTFRDAFRHRRCLVPVSYFIEWHTEKGGKQPYRIGHRNGRPMLLAGLWAPWKGSFRGEPVQLESFTIVVGKPNDLIGRIHDRMPVILEDDQARTWLTGTPDQVMAAADIYPATALEAVPISRRINRVKDAEEAQADWLDPTGPILKGDQS